MAAPKLATRQPPPFQLSLRIKHPSMDPSEISKDLHLDPVHAFRSGQPRHLKNGIATAAVHTESYWLAPLDPASWYGILPFEQLPHRPISQSLIDAAVSRSLEGALGLCALRLNKAHAALLHTIRSEGGETSLLVTLSPTVVNTFSLPPQISQILGELGITLEFEIA